MADLTPDESAALALLLGRVTLADMARLGLTVPQCDLALSAAVKLRQQLAMADPETRAWVNRVSQDFSDYGRSKGGEPVDVNQLMEPMAPRDPCSDASELPHPDGQERGHG